jgi:hypothetical protein
MSYFAELDNDGIVTRVIVADDLQWCVDNLGGTWAETADPYTDEPQTVAYCGPGFGHDDTFPERFGPPWVQPSPDTESGEWSSYPKGAVVFHDGHLWKSTIDGNVWQPGISAWHPEPDIDGVLPNWVQPTGAHDVWPLDAEVTHNGKRWRSTAVDNVWEPGVFGWVDMDAPTVAAWVQPTGAHNAYKIGDRVSFNGSVYESKINSNTWSPTAYPAGWQLIP